MLERGTEWVCRGRGADIRDLSALGLLWAMGERDSGVATRPDMAGLGLGCSAPVGSRVATETSTCTHEGSWGEGGGVLELGRALFPPPRAGWAWGRVAILPAQISQLRQNLSSRCVGVADQGSGLRRPQGLPEHPLPSVGT